MTEATLTSTSASPTARQVWTRTRGIVLAVVILLAAAVAIAAIRSGAQHGRLDPRSADPYGSRATAELLGDRGVSTRVVTTLDEARAAADADTTLLVAAPDLLTDHQQADLRAATKNSGGRTILIAPDSPSLGTLAPGVTADPAISFRSTLSPSCDLPAARRAGSADTGGIRYSTSVPGADVCYPSDGLPTLLRIPAATGNGDTVVLGAPDILYNNRLDKQGNASLALQLLGSRPHLVWYLPSLSDTSATDAGKKTFLDLLPSGWLWGTLQLFIAAGLAALWRARRLGPLVPERLPVAIRASETVEGRARLYRKANARDRAATALRSTTRTRLAPLIGVSPAQAHAPEALLSALSARIDGDGQALHALLFGPPPSDDAALISLADQLDALEREVRRS
ncbi:MULTISPECIES: DUF4350 domain-containing protein [Streptomyces]|uniref:DUF4350 domain-containing protein n=1 Tax=Streptomyces mirabilis TaxID=68239 RepID=A0ABU3USL8_9ACTN|nr:MULTISPECIES: DUF4350 domain-containing protein [Streptomyces]MCX4609259.1 DUF4350 domain-containing protein [Streptomyces mirabilis]MCX5349703.1 DUF4350 domain-containing protein [Streptomyces mirabilis]MDU8996918.1 DUF4350 domain-containing protein [Streptomyces mirabilis]QDN88143.1 DUF4350 domain-containing protein [Streptomyces sp. RLB3-6]QDO08979.1 DUF4350 domain-containing protein [Streptomyces sp. S1D4-23]